MVEIRDFPETFGVAEVLGLEPSGGGEHAAAIGAALARHGVVCLRMGEPLEDAELQSVARIFGPIKDPVGRMKDGGIYVLDMEFLSRAGEPASTRC